MKDHIKKKVYYAINTLISKYKNGLEVNFVNTLLVKSVGVNLKLDDGEVLKLIKGLKSETESGKIVKEEIVNSMIKQNKKSNKAIKRFKIITPINCKILKRKLEVNGLKFKIESGVAISKKYKNLEFYRYSGLHKDSRIRPRKINTHDRYFLIFELSGCTFWSVLMSNFKTLESISGIINYAINQGKLQYGDYNYSDEADFSIGTTIYSVCDEDKSNWYVDWNRLTRGLRAKRMIKTITVHEKNNLNWVLGKVKFSADENSIYQLILYSMRLYYYAQSSVHKYDRFMNYWRICEAISMSGSSGGQTRVVIERLSPHFAPELEKNIDISSILNHLAKIRNGHVHNGLFSANDDDINLLKVMCDGSIAWLISISNKINNKRELEYYYQHKTTSKSNIIALKNILSLKK